MAKLNFQQPLLQSLVSNDPWEIILICWFDAQDLLLFIIIVLLLLLLKTVVLLNMFVETKTNKKVKTYVQKNII